MPLKFGPLITPGPDTRKNDENHVYGEGWHAQRTETGFSLSWDGGGLGTNVVRVVVSEDEFERLRNEPDAFYEIALKHDPNSASTGSAETAPDGPVDGEN